MTVPTYFVTAFTDDPELSGIFVVEGEVHIYAASALGEGENPQIPPFPYLVWNELPSTPFASVDETSDAELNVYTFYVYDDMGRFDRIDAALRQIKTVVKSMPTFQAEDGTFCMDTEWMGFSGRFNDPTYHASVRYGTVRFAVNR